MYPTKVVDAASFEECLDRMYKDYCSWCSAAGGKFLIMEKNEWLEVMLRLDADVLNKIVSNFNSCEISVMSN
jgi:hypothetical protein